MFEDQTSDALPDIKDCCTIIKNNQGDGGTDFKHQVVGTPHREILDFGSCHFGIEAISANGNVEFYVSGQDVIDIINDAIAKFGNSNGKIGAKGLMNCNGSTRKQGNTAAAKLAGIEEDLNITDVQYQTCVSILFVGYILMQLPSNIIVGKIRWPGVYICAAMGIWGLLSALTCLVQNFAGLMSSCFFLGFIEAVFFPGALFYLSLFYNQKQYALRTAILYSGSLFGNAFGGLFAIGILKLDGTSGLEGWRWGSPSGNRKISAKKGFVMAVTDPKTWLLMATLYATQERYWHIVCPMVICVAANIFAVSTLNTAARYVAMMLMPVSFYGATAVILSWVAGSLSQPAIKRASAIAIINAVCNTPNVWCSYLYNSAPRYLVAFLVNLAASVIAIFLATATRMYLRRENHKLDNGLNTSRNGPTAAQQAAGFRYTL
ncbi:major facilitator superfamily domain-containing protein [Aspergillus crustosus]